MSDLNKKLVEIQQELKAPKAQYNSFGKYNYRSCEDILEAVKPLCASRGLSLVMSDEAVNVGLWVYIKSTARLQDDVEAVSAAAYAREPESRKGMDASQITGTASSYARKYALNGLFCIDDAKDADAQEQPPQQRPQQRPQQAAPPRQAPPRQEAPTPAPSRSEPPPAYSQQGPASTELMRAFHATGTAAYPGKDAAGADAWEEQRMVIKKHYGVSSTKDLAANIVSKLVDGMKKKMTDAVGNGG